MYFLIMHDQSKIKFHVIYQIKLYGIIIYHLFIQVVFCILPDEINIFQSPNFLFIVNIIRYIYQFINIEEIILYQKKIYLVNHYFSMIFMNTIISSGFHLEGHPPYTTFYVLYTMYLVNNYYIMFFFQNENNIYLYYEKILQN